MNMDTPMQLEKFCVDYARKLGDVLASSDWSGVVQLGQEMRDCWAAGQQVFFCGNGGSAGNAIHLANDFLYGIAKRTGGGMKVQALSANPAVITCLANDVGYDDIDSCLKCLIEIRDEIAMRPYTLITDRRDGSFY